MFHLYSFGFGCNKKWRIPVYIMDTTHPSCNDFQKDRIKWAKSLNEGGMFDSLDFVRFEHEEVEISEDGKEAYIPLRVTMRGNDSSEQGVQGNEFALLERCHFICEGKKWLYAGGDVTADVPGLENVALNN